jgi:MFS family permease
MPFASHFGTVCALLFFYGVYYGMTEGAERALVADFVPAKDRGMAYGWYHCTVGFAALPASLMFGVFWTGFGPKPAFFIGALLAASAVFTLAGSLVPRRNKKSLLNADRPGPF